jgi:hypothetical protein
MKVTVQYKTHINLLNEISIIDDEFWDLDRII